MQTCDHIGSDTVPRQSINLELIPRLYLPDARGMRRHFTPSVHVLRLIAD
ncbi:unnamed protein product [Larinioides sclopetarius]|uniref:Uncharacterized protein n=1 Tax=Larinioides sclopetarius TaxID=280406 RepID=A0AAV1YSK0_9ARAC